MVKLARVLPLLLVLCSCGETVTRPPTDHAASRAPASPVASSTGRRISDEDREASRVSPDAAWPTAVGPLAVPELLHFEITRAGEELHVRFVGRPRAPSAHPFPAATIPGGYRVSVTLVKMDGPRGWDTVGRIEDDDSVRIVRSNVALESQDPEVATRATRRRPPVLEPHLLRVPLRGGDSSWSFRVPRAVFGSNRFHWRLTLSEVGSRSFERFDGDVDLTRPDRSERVPALNPGGASP